MRHFDVTLKSKLYLYIYNDASEVNPSDVVHLLGGNSDLYFTAV
jgi:hypothetical protein